MLFLVTLQLEAQYRGMTTDEYVSAFAYVFLVYLLYRYTRYRVTLIGVVHSPDVPK